MVPDQPSLTAPSLNGIEKAAALLLIMGKDSASRLANYFSPDEIQKLSTTVSRFSSLEQSVVDSVVDEFQKNYMNMGLLAEPDSIVSIFEGANFGGSEEDTLPSFDRDADNDPSETAKLEQIKDYLISEPPYIAAFFMSTLDDELSARLFEALDDENRKTLFKLMLERRQPTEYFEVKIRSEILKVISERSGGAGANEKIESAAGLINYLAEDTGEGLMSFLQDENPEAAEILKKSIFKFSDFVKLDKKDRAMVLDQVETDDVTKSLALADDILKESVLDCLSQRNRRMVESELSREAPTEDVILNSQRKISGIVVALSREGKVALPQSD